MQEALGGAEAYKEAFLKKLDEVYAEEGDLTLEMGETSLSEEAVQDQSTAFAASREKNGWEKSWERYWKRTFRHF